VFKRACILSGPLSPFVLDGRDSLQIWRVPANILNKQSWTADREWTSSFGVRWRLTTPHIKEPACYEVLHRSSDLDRSFRKT